VVRCLTCGCIYRNPRPTLRAVTTQYAEDEYGAEHLKAEFQAQEAWPEGNITAFAQRCGFSTPAPVVVEVGSFVGGFLADAQRKGWAIVGLDPRKEVVNFCHAQGLPVIHGTLNETSLASQSADAVVIWNTLNHTFSALLPACLLHFGRCPLGSLELGMIRALPSGSFW
jgi:hypothetical protein